MTEVAASRGRRHHEGSRHDDDGGTTAASVRVSPQWLALREPADAAARSIELVETVIQTDPPVDCTIVHDLACGTGSMSRWLAPRLTGRQHWVLYDWDPDLLRHAAASLPHTAADGAEITFEIRSRDITRLDPADLTGASLITASALLDMLTADEVRRVVTACVGAACPALLTLSVVGRVDLAPVEALDHEVGAAFNDHQRRIVGDRRLLGPDAVGFAADEFTRLGAEVIVRPSPWRLGPAQATLAAEWFAGWLSAACRAATRVERSDYGVWDPAPDGGLRRPARRHGRSQRPSGMAAMTACGAAEPWTPRLAYVWSGSGFGQGPQIASASAAPSGRSGAGMSRTWWVWARLAGGAGVLAVLVWRLGTGPFLDGLRTISGWSLAAAVGIALVTTVYCAWRWSIVAHGLDVPVSLPTAIAAYYRSQFLNTTLPGGVLGDVHRGIRHGHDVGDLGRGLRAVAWERSAGQVVQIALALVVLLTLPSPVRSSMPIVAGVVVAGTLVVVLLACRLPDDGPHRWARILRSAKADVRDGVLARRSWPGIVLASMVVVIGHTATFIIAARTAGSSASLTHMLPLAMIVLLATGVPTNIAGWGPREGVAAWAFGAAGLGADQGLSTAVVYGILVLAASLPGAGVLVVAWVHRHMARRAVDRAPSGSSQPEPIWRTSHDDPLGPTTHPDPPMCPEWLEPARWRTLATAEPKGATRG